MFGYLTTLHNILYLERMCRVLFLELSDKQVDSNTVQHTKT